MNSVKIHKPVFRKQNTVLLFLFFIISISLSAQPPSGLDSSGYSRDYVFEHFDLSQVPSGLLYDYSMALAPLEYFDGLAPNDTNNVDEITFRLLYATLYGSVTTPAETLPDPLTNLAPVTEGNTIPYKMLFYRYNAFREDAVTAGLVNITNNQLYNVPNAPESPYLSKEVFVAMPWSKTELKLGTYYFTQDIITNLDNEVQSIWVDFGDGNGFQVWTAGTPLQVDYSTIGIKELTLKVRLSSGLTRTCNSQIVIIEPEGNNNSRYEEDDIFEIQVQGGGGTVSVLPFCEGSQIIQKPLIIINGIELPGLPDRDFYEALDRLYDFDDSPTNNFIYDDIESGGYDIIFIDWDNGVADLHVNGDFVRRAIRAINATKTASGSLEENVVVGMSMGGVCGKIALREMELAGEDHQTKVYFSFDAPLRGANFPLAAQHALDHLANISILGKKIRSFVPKLDELVLGLEAAAPKQLLIYHKDVLPDDPNGPYRTFYEYFKGLGAIQNCEHIALSNGSQVGVVQGIVPGAILAEVIDGNLINVLNLMGWSAFWSNTVGDLGQLVSGVKANVRLRALPDGTLGVTQKMYEGTYQARLFGIITILYSYEAVLSPQNCYAMDSAPGGLFPIQDVNLPSGPWIYIFSKKFCFIPTVSSIGVGPFQTKNGPLSSPYADISDNNLIFNSGQTDVSRIAAVDDQIPVVSADDENQWHTNFSYDNSGVFLTEILDGPGLTGVNTLTSIFNFGEGDIEFDYLTAIIGTIGLPINSSGYIIDQDLSVESSGELLIAHGDRINFVSNPANPNNIAETYRVLITPDICTGDPVTVTLTNGGILDIGEWDEAAGITNQGILEVGNNSTLNIKGSGKASINYNSELNIHDGALVVVQNGGTLEALFGGEITVGDGAELRIESGAILYIHGNSQLVVEPGGKLIIEQGAGIRLWDGTDVYGNAVIDVFGELDIHDDFLFSGNGYFKFENGYTLTLPTGKFSLSGNPNASEYSRFLELAHGAELDIQNGEIDLKYGLVDYGSHAQIKGGTGAVFKFTEIEFQGSEDALGVSALSNPAQFIVRNCLFNGFETAIEAYDIFSPIFFIDNTSFTNNEISLSVSTGGKINVTSCNFKGGEMAIEVDDVASFRITDCIIEEHVLPQNESIDNWGVVKLMNNVPEFIMNGGAIDNNEGAGIYSPAGSMSNVFLRDQATISDNDIGIHIAQGATLNGGLDYGLVLMDCANLLNNTVGIKGQDVLLQIDAYQNLGEDDPIYLRPNHFQQKPLGDLFEICYDLRDEQEVSAKGNYWGTDNANIETTVEIGYHLLQNTNTPIGCSGNSHNIPLIVSDKVLTEPTSCPEAPGTTDPDPGLEYACVIYLESPEEIVVHQEYTLAYRAFDEKLATDTETSDIKYMFVDVSSIDSTQRALLSEYCKNYIDVSRVMISAESMKSQIVGGNSAYSQTFGENHINYQQIENFREEKVSNIKLFPNPAKNYFQIDIPSSSNNYFIEIFDNLGRKVITTQGSETLEINTSTWNAGMYSVLLTDTISGELTSLKVVVE